MNRDIHNKIYILIAFYILCMHFILFYFVFKKENMITVSILSNIAQ